MSMLATAGQAKSMYHEVDTRFNLSELPPQLDQSARKRIEKQALSIACLVEKKQLIETTHNGFTRYYVSPRTLTLAKKLQADYEKEFKAHCAQQNRAYQEEEAKADYKGPFQDEPSLGGGTAFLVGKQLILTAAHCVCDSSSKCVSGVKLASLRVIFGFQMQPSGRVQTEFDSKDVYRIDAVWQYRLTNEADWALLKLDKEVEGRVPLSLVDSQMVDINTSLYMLGHSSGLPLKLTLSGQVQKTNHPHFFEADLDAFAGNSGSPVFANDTGNMVGMLLRGNRDYADSTSLENKQEKIIQVSKTSQKEIKAYGYEKCHNIASIEVVKIVLSSSFKLTHAHFSGRTQYLDQLKAHLTTPASSTQVHILYGPGGVGKSELAIAFANQNIEGFSFIWSISCGTEEEQFVGYQGLAQRLEIPLEEKETLSSLIHKVHHKLEQNRSKPWLLLLDNLQTHSKLPGRGGSVLITSKSVDQALLQGAVVATRALLLAPLEREEALNFLEMITKKPLGDCQKLLAHVGCYPLLLGQVVSYIKYKKIEVEDYLATFEHSFVSGGQESSLEKALEAAFSMTLEQLFPAAKEWLFLCSQLNAAQIPVSYLKTWLATEGLSEKQEVEIIAILEQYTLLRYNTQEEVFSLHLEFQRIILKSIAAKDIGDKVARLLAQMGKSWDFENTDNWAETMKKATIWASHAAPIIEVAEAMLFDDLDKASLLDGLGRWEEANVRYNKALEYHIKAFEIRRVVLGENDPNVVNSLTYIGRCYCAQGNYVMAREMHKKTLDIRRATLEVKHPDVAQSLNNIGVCYYNQRNYTEALKAYREALQIFTWALGENHLEVATSLNNIGNCHASQGNHSEALKWHGEALKIRKDALGENHPHVAMSLNNMGACYESQKNFAEALKLFGAALQVYRAALGENHPHIAMSLNNIGTCYIHQRNYAEALRLFNQALKVYKAILGENHPDAAISFNNIGFCYESQGNYAEALNAFGKVLKIKQANQLDVKKTLLDIERCQVRSKCVVS